MSACTVLKDEPTLISHAKIASDEQLIREARERVEAYQGTDVTKHEMHKMIDQLLDHSVLRHVFLRKGLDGAATQFLISGAKNEDNQLVRWICDEAPVVLATRERFGIFHNMLQDLIHSGSHIASVPCGVMDDLLKLDISNLKNVTFTGIDLDSKSLELAKQSAKEKGCESICSFYRSDAWNLGKFDGCFDVVTSNGLNIYEPDDTKVVGLYKEFLRALKPGGALVTSFLTPPTSGWKNIDAKNAAKQRILFGTIIGAAWQHFRTEEVTIGQLKDAGFIDIRIIYDSRRMFPTIIAKKPL